MRAFCRSTSPGGERVTTVTPSLVTLAALLLELGSAGIASQFASRLIEVHRQRFKAGALLAHVR